MLKLRLLFFAVLTLPVSFATAGVVYTPPAGQEKGLSGETLIYKNSYAVVIGINQYNSDKIGNLQGAVRDAEAVAEVFRQRGMNVRTFIDDKATNQAIREYLGDVLPQIVKEEDQVIVYFAGHGVSTGKSDTAMGYLLPVDADRDKLRSKAISMRELQSWFNDYDSKHVMFIADACYSGLALNTRAVAMSDTTRDYLKYITSLRVRVTLVAGTSGEEAHEWQGHGLFTYYFLQALNGAADYNNDGLIISDEIAAYVKNNVSQTAIAEHGARQNPQIGRSGEGEIIFLNPRGAGVKPSEQEVQPSLAKLQINLNPTDSTVKINGKPVEQSLLSSPLDLKPGNYKIEIFKDGMQTYLQNIELKNGDNKSLSVTLQELPKAPPPKPVLALNINETGADILLNDKFFGKSPLTEPVELPEGTYSIKVTKQGFSPEEKEITVTQEPFQTLDIELKPKAEQQPSPSRNPLVAIGAAGTAAMTVASGIMWGIAGKNKSDFNTHNEDLKEMKLNGDWDSELYEEAEAERDKAKTFAGAAVGTTVAAAAFLALLTAGIGVKKHREKPQPNPKAITVAPTLNGIQVSF